MRERTIIALWKHLAGGQRLRLRAVSVLVIALGSAALLAGPGIDSTARAQTTVDYDVDGDGLIEVATIAQLNAIRWDLDGDGVVDPGGDAAGYATAFPDPMASMGCAATGCVGYELTANLDLLSAGDSVTGWAPIGGASNAFAATFDGGAPGFTVSNLTINNSSLDRVGLFGETGPGSVVRNVTLADVNITGRTSTGALVGRNNGSILDSSATGIVSGTEDTGGLVGAIVHPGGVIVGSTAGVSVTGRAAGQYIGGLAGLNNGLIIDSRATGDVTGVKWVGGLVGSNDGTGGVNSIRGSTAAGAVTGSGDLVGGLVGWNNGQISSSHATGTVTGSAYVGGLVGSNSGAGGVNRISGSTAAGAVTGSGNLVGGLVGWNNGPISSSHATGDVIGVKWVGGLVGSNNGAGGVNRISGSTADGVVTSTGDFAGGLVGWNNGPISGSHATGDVSGGSRVGGLVGSNYDDDAWNGRAVALNEIEGSTAGGAVTGTDSWVGGLVGWNNGPISDSHATGTRVSGYEQVGGLVGTNENQTADGANTISRSTASAAVTATNLWVGGLVGWNNGQISDSVATGTVSGVAYVGGLVGESEGPISDSHASGSVQGQTESGGLVGWNHSSITDSSASGDVGDAATEGQALGGLIGLNSGGAVTRSSATGDVASTSHTIGGLVGRNEGTITESSASGTVTGDDWVGGLVGWNGLINSAHSISASRASGNVTGSGKAAGGLVGRNAGTIRASYATGTVTGAVSVGGLVGHLLGAIVAAYASGDVTGSGNAVGGLVGQSDSTSTVRASYAAGSVSGDAGYNVGGLTGVARAPVGGSSYTNNYWDTERSDRSVGVGSDDADASGSIDGTETATSGVTGQTTSALQTPTGYTGIYADWNIDSGDPWDFGGAMDDPELTVPPNAPPAFSSTAVSLTVAENAAVGSNVGAAVTAIDSDADTLTYKLVGAGGAAFDIASATGQLQVGAALDHETTASYTVTVQASDGKNVAFKDVTVTVTGVDETPALSGDAAPAVADSGAGFVSTYTATDPEGDAVGAITWSLAGTDSSYFTIEDGRLRFSATPDYEDPNHGASYAVTVQAAIAGQQGGPLTHAVTVTVVNVDDAGVVSLSAAQPEEGIALTATLSDLDGGVSGTIWQWERIASTNGAWTDISMATSATYTPTSADAGHYLRATASYDDAEDSGKSAQGVSDNPLAKAPGVTVTPTSLMVAEGGSGTYTVVLDSQPTGDVTVTIVDPTDNTDVTAGPATLTFTTTNWNSAQTVTVSAAQDADADDDTATVTHTVSGYGTVSTAPEVSVTVTDNDTRGITVAPTSLPVTEGDIGTYTVVLDTQPTDNVTVTIINPVDNTDVTAEPASLTFSPSNWSMAQTVTVSAAEDDDPLEDTVTVTHTVTGGDYGSVTALSVTVTVTDNDTRGVTVSPTSLTVDEGSTDTYTVVLDTLPTGNVTVAIGSNNTDVTADAASLTFTMIDWNTEQTVTVTAGQDADAVNDAATLTHVPSGADYDSVSNADLTVTVSDDETAGVTVSPASLTVGEGGSGTYTVVLDTQPTGDVTVTIVDPTDNADVTAEPPALTFTTTNWDSAQTVTVSAVQDTDTDDDTATVTHTVSGYGSVSSAASVTVTVAEDPTAPYDTNGNGSIDKDEASVSVRGYLSDGTPSKAVASAVVRRYLSGE